MIQLKLSKRYHRIGKPIKKAKPSPEGFLIGKKFEDYQSSNYNTIAVQCLCGNDNSYIISTVDREGWEYPLVLWRSCGLIRAKDCEIYHARNWEKTLKVNLTGSFNCSQVVLGYMKKIKVAQ